MQAVQALFRVPEVAATMREMSKEMMRAGILEEMIEDTFESMEDTEEIEAEAEDEIQNVMPEKYPTSSDFRYFNYRAGLLVFHLPLQILWEVTAGQLGKAPAAANHPLPNEPSTSAAANVSEDEDEEEMEKMQSRLEALRS